MKKRRTLDRLSLWVCLLIAAAAHAGPTTPTWQRFGPPGNVYDYSALDPVTRRQYLLTPSEGTDSVLCMWSTPIDSAQDWQQIETLGLSPALRPNELHGILMSAIDPAHRHWIVGVADDSHLRSFSFDTQRWSTLTWVQQTPTVAGFETAIDSSANRLYRLGGPLEFHLFPIRQGPPASLTLDSLLAAPLDPPWDNNSTLDPYTLRDAAFALDSRRHRLWVHGGQYWATHPNFPGSVLTSDDLWMFDLNTSRWSLVAQSGAAPGARYRHHFEVDTLQDRLILWGGLSATGVAQEDWWTLPLGTTTNAVWTPLVPAEPQPRPFDVGVFDPLRRVFSFAGGSGDARGGRFELAIDGTPHWRTIVPDRTDPPNARRLFIDRERSRATLVTTNNVYDSPIQPRPDWAVHTGTNRAPDSCAFVWDERRHRVLALGGGSGVSAIDTVLAMDRTGGAWVPIVPIGARPPARFDASAVMDEAHDRVLVFGGRGVDAAQQRVWLNDVWALSLTDPPTWTRLDTLPGTSPAERQGATLVYDEAGRRLVVWGGLSPSGVLADVQTFSLATGIWTTLAPAGTAPRWQDRFSVWDPTRRRLWVLGTPQFFSRFYTLSLADTPAWAQPELQGDGPFLRGTGFATPSRLVGDYDPAGDRLVIQRHAPGQGTIWTLSMFDPRLPASPLQLSALVLGSRAEIVWWVGRGAAGPFTVERRTEGGDWLAIDTPAADEAGEVHHASEVPELGRRYDFRLGVGAGAQTIYSDTLSLEFPRAFVGQTMLTSPEPQSGDLQLSFAVPTGIATVDLTLFDLQGRVRWQQRYDGDGRRYTVRLTEPSLPSGLYFVRLHVGERTLATRRVTHLR